VAQGPASTRVRSSTFRCSRAFFIGLLPVLDLRASPPLSAWREHQLRRGRAAVSNIHLFEGDIQRISAAKK
jgi:hypothetical protein